MIFEKEGNGLILFVRKFCRENVLLPPFGCSSIAHRCFVLIISECPGLQETDEVEPDQLNRIIVTPFPGMLYNGLRSVLPYEQ